MRLLLTGATGFVGRNILITALANKTYERIFVLVRSLNKLGKQLREDGYPRIPETVVPIQGAAPEWNIEPVQADHLIHSAGVLFGQSEEDFLKANAEGTVNLLKRCASASKILILSSQSAAGPCGADQLEKTEQDKESPVSWYGKSKLLMERQVTEKFADRNFLFLRPPMILGPRDSATLPLFQMAQGWVQFKPGFQTKYYSFVSVGDLIAAIFAALDPESDWRTLPHHHFFVAAKKPISDIELIQGAAAAMGRKGRILSIPQFIIDLASRVIRIIPRWRDSVPSLSVDRVKEIAPNRWVVSPQAFEAHFGWNASENLQPTLKSTHAWYLKTGQICSC